MLIRRGFVAAPLIGTIIFLAAIMFAVNLSKTDSAEVSHVVSDAYHNRIVSLLEMYRADLGAVFTVGLSRNVEYFLTGQCWASAPFNIETNGQGGQTVAEGKMREQAYDNCVLFNKILKAVVCSIDPKYGMKAWLSQMSETTTFEGISFEPANGPQFTSFINSGWTGASGTTSSQVTCNSASSAACCRGRPAGETCTENTYTRDSTAPCEKLIEGSLFDCQAFAYGGNQPGEVKQCCSVPSEDRVPGANPPACTTPVDGCDTGIFYIGMKIEDTYIFPRMPRIKASDGLGNEIRSGALADKDFAIPVNYPLFKYYGDAFQFYKKLAYSGTSNPAGIMDGLCYEDQAVAGTACASVNVNTAKVSSSPKAGAGTELFNLFTLANQSMVDLSNKPKYNVSLQVGNQFIDSDLAVSTYLGGLVTESSFGPDSEAYAHVKEVSLTVKFNDTDSTYQVDSAQPNQFCWLAHPSFQ